MTGFWCAFLADGDVLPTQSVEPPVSVSSAAGAAISRLVMLITAGRYHYPLPPLVAVLAASKAERLDAARVGPASGAASPLWTDV